MDLITQTLADDGIVFLKNALSPDELALLRRGADQLHAAQHDAVRNARFYSGEWPPLLRDVQRWPTLLRIAREIIGNDIALFARRFLIKDSRFSGSVSAHQDCPYWHGTVNKLHLFLPVTPNTAQTGAVRYYAGSHKYGLIGQGDIDASEYSGIREVGDESYPGDIIVMDHFTWHYSPPKQSDDPRYLLQLIYQHSSCGSYYEQPELVSGEWRTTIRFPYSEALILTTVQAHVRENERLRAHIADLERARESA
jgi:hypothetical protein